jgi:Arylsulfotransferase (ASST)
MRRAVLVAVLPVMIGIFPWTPGPGIASVAAAGPPGTVSCAPSPVGPSTPVKPVSGFTPMSPIRLIDTRDGTGGPSGVLGIGCVLRIDTSSITDIPAGADALSLSVTSVDAPQLGFLTVFPCGGSRPGTSNINTRIGVAAANNVVAALDSTRAVCIYASAVTHLVVDLFGWYGSSGMQYVDIAPVRALDTRFGPTPTGVTVGRVLANTPLVLPMAASWVPGEAEAVLVNLTVASSLGPGYLVAYPCGTAPPLASNVNFLTGEDRAGSTMVGLGPDGSLCLLSNVDVHMVVDVNGYFEPARFGPKTIIQPLAGSRIVDSRDGTGGWSTRLAANEVRSFDPTPSSALIDNVYSATLNVIATEAVGAGHLRLFPCGGATPTVSSLNFDAKGEATNLVTVPVGQDGRICVFASIATQVVIDEFATLQAPGLAKRLVITGGVPFPTFDATGLDYDMICPAAGADLSIFAVGTPQVVVAIDGVATTALTVKHLAVDGLLRLKFTRGAESTEYTLRCLPPDFPPYNIDRPIAPQPGWYLGGMGWSAATVGRFIVILDNHGAVIWYKRTDNQFVLDVKPWPSGSPVPALAWTPQLGPAFGTNPARGYRVTSLDGHLVAELKSVVGSDTDHHDMISLPGGNRTMITYVERSGAPVNMLPLQPVASPGVVLTNSETPIDSYIQELAPNGTLLFDWHSDLHFNLLETSIVPQRFVTPDAPAPKGGIDLLHINSIDRQPDGDYIVSARHLDAVFRIDHATGTVMWKLGGNSVPNHDGAAHMTIIGDPLGGPKRMHDARLNADGVLTMFDNQSGTGQAPRVVAYQLDETAHTATMLWQRPYPIAAGSSFGLGSARLQPNGSVVISWGVLQPMLEELDSAGNRLLAVTDPAPGAISYRFIKEPPATFDREQLLQLAGGNAAPPP